MSRAASFQPCGPLRVEAGGGGSGREPLGAPSQEYSPGFWRPRGHGWPPRTQLSRLVPADALEDTDRVVVRGRVLSDDETRRVGAQELEGFDNLALGLRDVTAAKPAKRGLEPAVSIRPRCDLDTPCERLQPDASLTGASAF
jgi:hypothetical protein